VSLREQSSNTRPLTAATPIANLQREQSVSVSLIMLSFILLVELCLLSQSGSTESPNPAALNQIRLPPTYSFSGTFEVTLQPTATAASPSCATITPGDVKGPFHIKPETVPDAFPPRQEACVHNPVCISCDQDAAIPLGYNGGLPLELSVTVKTAGAGCAVLGSSDDATVDIWQADPAGAYWQASDLWANRRQRREGADVPTHMYNCRAHGEGGSSGDGGEGGGGGAEGEILFTTLIPGHYIAGSAWRPRHIHLRARAPGHQTLVTQIYFGGDPFSGEADTACSVCKSDHELLQVQLELKTCKTCAPQAFSLANLTDDFRSNCDQGGLDVCAQKQKQRHRGRRLLLPKEE